MTKNNAHNKLFYKQIFFVVYCEKENTEQPERMRQLFKSKYGISKRKVFIDKKAVMGKRGVEYIAYIYAPTVAQLKKGRKTHVNYKDFICG